MVQGMLDLVRDGHTKGKQSEKNVTPQPVVEQHNPIDARDMVGEADVLKSAESGPGGPEEDTLIGA